MNPEKQKLDNLTIIRFFAAFAVFLLHAGSALVNSEQIPEWLKNITHHGGEGVTIFFVLSGFILSYNYQSKIANSTFKFKSYFVNRFARVYPMYLFALIVGIPFMISHAKFIGIAYGIPYLGTNSLSRIFLLHAWYPYFNDHPHWLTQGWTLSVELLFYVSFPFLLGAIESVKRYVIPIWLIFILLSWLPRMLVLNHFGEAGDQWVQQFPLLRLPEFIVGICSFYVFNLARDNVRLMLFLKYGGMIALLFVLAQTYRYVQSPWTLGLVLSSSLLVVGLAGHAPKGEPGSLRKFFIFLGEASYSLYLIHGFTILLVYKSIEKYLKTDSEKSFLPLGVCLVVTIIASGLCYRFIEEPARRWVRKKSAGPTPPA